MSTEASLWDWLRPRLPEGRYSRIESETSPGFPDVDYTIEGVSGTLELKCSRKKLTNRTTRPFSDRYGLRRSQKAWMTEEMEANGIVWIVAQVEDQVFFIPGALYREFNYLTMREMNFYSKMTLSVGALLPNFKTRTQIKCLLMSKPARV